MSRLSYRPVLNRSLRLVGYALLIDGQVCPTALWSTAAADDAAALTLAGWPESLGERLRQALTRLIAGGDASAPLDSPIRYWLTASPAILSELAREAPGPLDLGMVWVLPATALVRQTVRNDVQRALDRGHRLGAVVEPADFEDQAPSAEALAAAAAGGPFAEPDPARLDPLLDVVLERFESLHVTGTDATAFAAAGHPRGRLAALRRSGCRLHVAMGPEGPTSVFADAQEGFAPPLRNGDPKGASPTYGLVLKALQMTQSNAPASRIEDTLRTDPVLTFRLLRYANAAAFRGPERIEHLAHAINRVGYRQFGRWLALGLVTSQVDRGGTTTLINQAVVRALVLEILAQRETDFGVRDQVFITGLFSMLGAIVGQPLPGLVAAAMVSEEVKAALIDRSGPLHERLAMAEALEADVRRVAGASDRALAAFSGPAASGAAAARVVTAPTGPLAGEPDEVDYALIEAVARAPTLV